MDEDNNDKDSRPLFQGIDEFERTYAPQELPKDDPEGQRARLDDDTNYTDPSDLQPPKPAPVASVGSSPSGEMAHPNTGYSDRGGEPGDLEIESRRPIGNDDVPDDEV
jgi:hypothetical protein